MKFRGCTERLGQSTYRTASDDEGHLCADACHSYITNQTYDRRDTRVVAWGYDGKAPDLLSVGLLACTLLGFDFCYFAGAVVDWNCYGCTKPRYSPEVRRLHRKFTKQVVSKLPDNWEMTTDEIKAWIKNHKKLPACIKQQNQRKHGKAKAEKEGSVV